MIGNNNIVCCGRRTILGECFAFIGYKSTLNLKFIAFIINVPITYTITSHLIECYTELSRYDSYLSPISI